MKSIVTKAIIGILGTGAVTTGVVYATLPDNYGSYLNRQGRPLLTNSSGEWENVKTKYNNEGDDLLITLNGRKIEKNQLQVEQLKTWCSQNSGKTFTNIKDETYRRVSAWCTKPTTIEKQIDKGKTILNDTDPSGGTSNNNPDEQKWQNKVSTYNKAGNNKLIKEISNTSESSIIQINGGVTSGKLRAWCKYSKSKHFKHEEDQRYLTYLEWCVV